MRIVRKTVVALVFSMALGGAAWAGFKADYPVTVNTTARVASGSLGSARNGADANSYLGCWTFAHSDDTATATCYARNSDNTTVSCLTTVPKMIAAVSSVNGDSFIRFYWNTDGSCAEIQVYNIASATPKVP